MMTPLALEMLVWFCTRAPQAGAFANMDRDPQQEILSWFLREGIVNRGDDFARATDKGHAWLKLICETPMPVRLWVDLRESKNAV